MLPVVIPDAEAYNEATEMFEVLPGATLQLEHSLISLSKWEAKWKKSFLYTYQMTVNELIDYVRCMTINKISDDTVYTRLTEKNMTDIRTYIDDPMTATTISHKGTSRRRNRVITTEQIYGWMVEFGIPFDPCEKWHLNRLMMLIEVCGQQQTPGKKMSQKERFARQNAQLARLRGGKK